jgi:hypothetical protein
MGGTVGVALVVNTYERTYRSVLAPGFFPKVVDSNLRQFDEVVALVNNVDDESDARSRAETLLSRGEITGYAFVADHIGLVLERTGLTSRSLRRHPYLLDYGLVMPHVCESEWLLGWDAETELETPANWVDPGIELLESNPRLFHTSLAWPGFTADSPGYEVEEVGRIGDYSINWGFSDQLFLLRRADLIGKIYQRFAPMAAARHAPHPTTFEYRVEANQRAMRRPRATLTTVRYKTHDVPGGVLGRVGSTRFEYERMRALYRLEYYMLKRLPKGAGPRWSNSAPMQQG